MSLPEKPVLRLVAYYRAAPSAGEVSVASLDKQRAAVNAYGWFRRSEIVAEHTELESSETRPQLVLAISTALRMNADLLIADLGFLIENRAFLIEICRAGETYGVKTLACGFGDGEPLPVKFLMDKFKFISRSRSEATRAGLEASRARGTKLGATGSDHLCIANAARFSQAEGRRKEYLVAILKARRSGAKTLQAIANALMAQGIKTPRGNANWDPSQVKRMIDPGRKKDRAETGDTAENPKPQAEPDRARNRVLH